jgi:hypothetical protein
MKLTLVPACVPAISTAGVLAVVELAAAAVKIELLSEAEKTAVPSPPAAADMRARTRPFVRD